jgi:hypothetical protein
MDKLIKPLLTGCICLLMQSVFAAQGPVSVDSGLGDVFEVCSDSAGNFFCLSQQHGISVMKLSAEKAQSQFHDSLPPSIGRALGVDPAGNWLYGGHYDYAGSSVLYHFHDGNVSGPVKIMDSLGTWDECRVLAIASERIGSFNVLYFYRYQLTGVDTSTIEFYSRNFRNGALGSPTLLYATKKWVEYRSQKIGCQSMFVIGEQDSIRPFRLRDTAWVALPCAPAIGRIETVTASPDSKFLMVGMLRQSSIFFGALYSDTLMTVDSINDYGYSGIAWKGIFFDSRQNRFLGYRTTYRNTNKTNPPLEIVYKIKDGSWTTPQRINSAIYLQTAIMPQEIFINRVFWDEPSKSRTFYVDGLLNGSRRLIASKVSDSPLPQMFSNGSDRILAIYGIDGDSRSFYTIFDPDVPPARTIDSRSPLMLPFRAGSPDKALDCSGRIRAKHRTGPSSAIVITGSRVTVHLRGEKTTGTSTW